MFICLSNYQLYYSSSKSCFNGTKRNFKFFDTELENENKTKFNFSSLNCSGISYSYPKDQTKKNN